MLNDCFGGSADNPPGEFRGGSSKLDVFHKHTRSEAIV